MPSLLYIEVTYMQKLDHYDISYITIPYPRGGQTVGCMQPAALFCVAHGNRKQKALDLGLNSFDF